MFDMIAELKSEIWPCSYWRSSLSEMRLYALASYADAIIPVIWYEQVREPVLRFISTIWDKRKY